MKQYYQNLLRLNYTLIICSLHFSANANTNCATQLTSSQAEYITETQDQRDAIDIAEAITDNIEVPVVAHILGTNPDSGNPTIDANGVESALNDLNSGFSQAGFHFSLCTPVNEIPYEVSLEKIYFSIYNNTNEYMMTNETLVPRALNIYFVPDAIAPSGGSVCGWASFPAEYYQNGKNWIVIRSDCATNKSTLIHEVGHFFNLYHTHQGENPNLGITEDELVDCSNCGYTVGDGVEDTPAEPYMNGKGLQAIVNENCEILCEYHDAAGNVYDIGQTIGDDTYYNYMSYAPNDCRNHFSQKQIDRMKKSYLVDRNYLSNSCPGEALINCDPLRDEKVLQKLYSSIEGSTPGSWNGVTFNNDNCVTAIELPNAGLEGEIPIQIDNLKLLTTLNLSNNNICGTLPASIVNLPQLQLLNLSNNQITGEIPCEIENLESLTIMDLSSNHLSGYIPYELTELQNLQELKLAGNEFSGCLRADLNSFINQLEIQDQFSNGFNICSNCHEDDWQALKYIYENMGLKQSIISSPFSIPDKDVFIDNFEGKDARPWNCDLNGAYNILLNNNGRVAYLNFTGLELIGELTDNFLLLTDIVQLHFGNNNLTGTIPDSFVDLKMLQYINLDNNSVESCIPVKLTQLCGQTAIEMDYSFYPEDFLWREACRGQGNYCEEDLSDYVMPGDFNNDKKVSNIDLVYWRYGRTLANTTGTSRINPTTAWLPQESQNWDEAIWGGINKKHLDANGDGSICPADLNAFYQNFDKGTAFDADQNEPIDPPTLNGQFSLTYSSGNNNNFYLTINNLSEEELNVLALIFTVDLGEFSYQEVSFKKPDSENVNTPIFQHVHHINGTNLVEVALVWDELEPAPIDWPFGVLVIQVDDNGGEGIVENFRIENINILNDGSNALFAFGGLDINFDSGIDEESDCSEDWILEGDLTGDYTYNAANSIVAPLQDEDQQAYVTGCTNMNFLSGRAVELNPGFRTQHGVVFCAGITEEPCEVQPALPKLSQSLEIGLYPNPANQQTTIAYNLAENGAASLHITDITGKHLTTLLNKATQAKGKHTVPYNTSQLPTGVYYFTLKHNENISTQKLIVVR